MKAPKFIVFAHPRSGSTTLANILNAHPDLSVLVEPFLDPKYSERIVDCQSLDAQLDDIFAMYDGIKVISWPLAVELYAHMLADESRRVVFLRRRNILKASMSCAISHRIGVWHKQDLPSKPDALYEAVGEIPISEITDWIEAVQEVMDQYEAILDSRSPGTAMKITYEELYSPASLQKEMLHRIFDFLGVRRIQSLEISELLDKGRSQMNTQETYRWVRNYREIDEIGAGKGYGTLFEP